MSDLAKKYIEAKRLYYYGNATMSDAEFDALEDQIRAEDPDNPLLKIVGTTSDSNKVKHLTPMLSLEKITEDIPALAKWMGTEECVMSQKMDGTACSLIYQDGVFLQAKTRGDGTQGEDITEHLKRVGFPKLIPHRGFVEIRGELVISYGAFDKYKDWAIYNKQDVPNSIRNCVAGLLNRKTDTRPCGYLTFKAYSLSKDVYSFESALFDELGSMGFTTPKWTRLKKEMLPQSVDLLKEDDEFLTDGLVIAYDSLTLQKKKGFTSHHPKGKIAFKFASETAETTVTAILTDVGRTGKISFVAEVEPTYLSGASISKVTLHNAGYIKKHSISIGGVIKITRSGEVIPKHLATLKHGDWPYQLPTTCPSCGGRLEKRTSKDAEDLVCITIDCPKQAVGNILHWIKVLSIDGFGPSMVEKLYNAGKLKNIPDLYRLKEADIARLEGSGKVIARKLIKNIEKAKAPNLDIYLAGLGLPHLGKSTAKVIAKRYPSLDDFSTAMTGSTGPDVLCELEGIDTKTASGIGLALRFTGWANIQQLRQLGVEPLDYIDPSSQPLNGKSFVITGALSKPRPVLKKELEDLGAAVKGSVSKKTDYLITNETDQTGKFKKATELGIPILNEDALADLLKELT